MKLRHFLSSALSLPANPPERADIIVIIDHHSAFIQQFEPSVEHPTKVAPYDPSGRLRHLHHVQGHDQGRRSPEDPTFYQKIAELIDHAATVVIFAHGDGNADTSRRLQDRLITSSTEPPFVIEVRADAKSFTEAQLLDAARAALTAGR